jgi:putative methionine-R-sulfoxide reductase with GAF domain
MVEQRLFLRKKLLKPLPIELLPGKEVWLDDLGEGGLGVSGSSRLEVGSVTFLTFQFPEANSLIEAAGVVVWCHESGRVGVRFTKIKQDSSAALKRWLKESGTPTASDQTGGRENTPDLVSRARGSLGIEELKNDVSAARARSASELDVIVERMLRLTRSTGAAIALRNSDKVVCRASIGNAPAVGIELNVGSGLSADCYRTGNIVTVSDCETDLRVDKKEVCRQLDFRSLLIVPISMAGDVIGIAEVFSPLPSNFEGGDVLLLSSIAELIAEIYHREQSQTAKNIDAALDVGRFAPEITDSAAELKGDRREVENTKTGLKPDPAIDTVENATQDANRSARPAGVDVPTEATLGASKYRLLSVLLTTTSIGFGVYLSLHSRAYSRIGKQQSEAAIAVKASSAVASTGLVPSTPQSSETQVPSSNQTRQAPDPKSKAAELSSISKRVTPGKLIHRVAPVLPDFAREGDIKGPLVLSATITKDGRLRNAKLVSGPPALAVEAFHALREWRYTPYLVDGHPIEAETRIVMDFER